MQIIQFCWLYLCKFKLIGIFQKKDIHNIYNIIFFLILFFEFIIFTAQKDTHFGNQMAAESFSMKVLIVEDDVFSRKYFNNIVTVAGYDCKAAEDGKVGLQVFKDFKPDLIISDIQMPNMDGLTMLAEIRKQKSDAIVIMATAFDSEDYAIKALELGANNYLKKPVHAENLKRLLNKYYTIVKNRTISSDIIHNISQLHFIKQFKSDMSRVPMIVEHLMKETHDTFEDNERIGLELGLAELLANAVEHGNLEIDYPTKSAALDNDELDSLYLKKLADPKIAARKVTVEFTLNDEYCEWIIADEGQGFDYNAVQNPLKNESILKLHGRGIFISKFQFDDLEYLGKGNVVRIRKNRKGNSNITEQN